MRSWSPSTGWIRGPVARPTGFVNGYGTHPVVERHRDSRQCRYHGSGTLSIASTQTGTMQFAYWVISATRLAIIPLDPVAPIINGDPGAKPASGGVAEKQGTIIAGNLATGSYVYAAMGFDTNGVFDKGGRIVSTGAATANAVTDEVGATEGQHLDVATTYDDTISASGRSDIFCTPGSYGLRTFFVDGNRAFTLVYSTAHLAVGELYKQSADSYAGTDVAGDYAYLAFGDETANNIVGAVAVTAGGVYRARKTLPKTACSSRMSR